jgi:membrane protease YdiL (CAAX protease family)
MRFNRRRWLPWVLGLGYSFAMRLVIGIITIVLLTVVALWMMATQDVEFSQAGFDSITTELGTKYQPDVKTLVDVEAIANSPIYLFLNVTLVSFVLAAFREELWRAAMLAGCRGLFPGFYESRKGKVLFVLLVAIVFGIGHWPQGPGGVFLTTLLGIMLGLIMVYHGSIWEATLAHGFFNATSFVGMYFLYRLKDQYPELQKMLGAW